MNKMKLKTIKSLLYVLKDLSKTLEGPEIRLLFVPLIKHLLMFPHSSVKIYFHQREEIQRCTLMCLTQF